MKKIVIASIVCSSLLLAVGNNESKIFSPETMNSLNEKELVKKVPKDLKMNKEYLNINPKDIKRVQKKDRKLQETFDKYDGAILNYKPVLRPISTNDEIMVHPYFSTTILLPVGAVIDYPDISIEPTKIKYGKNTVLFRMKKDFEIGNLTLIYKLDGKNYVMSVLLKRYDRKNTDDKLSLVYHYKDLPKRNPFEVINAYVEEHHHLPNRKFNYIWLDGISYRIIKVANNSSYKNAIFYKRSKYLVDIGNAR